MEDNPGTNNTSFKIQYYKGLLERHYFKTEKEQKPCKTKIFFTDEEEREVTK